MDATSGRLLFLSHLTVEALRATAGRLRAEKRYVLSGVCTFCNPPGPSCLSMRALSSKETGSVRAIGDLFVQGGRRTAHRTQIIDSFTS
jgi:hypothetical protein